MSWVTAVGKGVKSFAAGGGLGLLGGIGQTAANIWQTNRIMDFQKKMSDTAHRREVADLRAAGLNPVLSATGGSGASTPQGMLSPVENIGKDFSASQIAKKRQRNEAFMMKAQIGKMSQDAATAESQEVLNSAKALRELSETALTDQQKKKVGSEIDEISARIKNIGAETSLKGLQRDKLEYEMSRLKRLSEVYDIPVLGNIIAALEKLLNIVVPIPLLKK